MGSLEVCVVDTDTGIIYEWNGSQTVNAFDIREYGSCIMLELGTPTTIESWVMEECRNAEDFVASVKEHTSAAD